MPLNDHQSQKSLLLMALGLLSSILDPAPKLGEARSRHKKELPLAKILVPAPKEGDAHYRHKKELYQSKMMSGRMVQGSQNAH